MTLKDVIELVNQMVEQHRADVGDSPDIMPVVWNGINITLEEAKLVIRGLEVAKVKYQKAMNNYCFSIGCVNCAV